MNNERIIQSLNAIKIKKLNNGYPVTLYGEANNLSMTLLENFPLELDVGWTEIVSFGDIGKIFMMVRDRGHALTIEIDYTEKDILISYFIPKICNAQMINRLPGVNKIKENADPLSQATGRFLTSKERLNEDLYHFIEMVPMDENMNVKNEEYHFGR